MSQIYTSIETFAWCWWLAIWMEMAGFRHILLNDNDKYSTDTLKLNRPKRNVVHDDIANVTFSGYNWKVDVLTWWYPCQAFSYAGKKLWLEDSRWVLFLEFARAVQESQPKVFVVENVKWLLNHDNWRTVQTMLAVFRDLWYYVYEPKLLKAIHHWVPQKRERVFIVWIRWDIYQPWVFERPKISKNIYTLKDALKKWALYDRDVPISPGSWYPEKKKQILDLIPPWGYRRNLPLETQKEYMWWSFYLWWWKTWIARRISWDEACLTLTCSPAQKQTERCHPDETRPFTVREYARIQTFPDDWVFAWPISQQYKQIWNAVPVNLAFAVWKQIKIMLDKIWSLPHKRKSHEEIQSLIYQGQRLIQAC